MTRRVGTCRGCHGGTRHADRWCSTCRNLPGIAALPWPARRALLDGVDAAREFERGLRLVNAAFLRDPDELRRAAVRLLPQLDHPEAPLLDDIRAAFDPLGTSPISWRGRGG